MNIINGPHNTENDIAVDETDFEVTDEELDDLAGGSKEI
ncbi:hypothetical protein EDD90_2065 [Streptomyces sp. Ag109_O5-1]|nr:hypothetical protein EDD90_2065 [Streptomyces sp. Ag109_O5-1]